MQHVKYPHLFSKGKVGKVTTKNRVIRNSMGTYLNVGKLCDVSDRNIKHAAEAAEGGPGIVFWTIALLWTAITWALRHTMTPTSPGFP